MSRFDGSRVYNGCPDSTLARAISTEAKYIQKIQNRCPRCSVTYFPIESKFMGFMNHKPITKFVHSKRHAWKLVEEYVKKKSKR